MGFTLREVLRYSSVEKIVLVEIDDIVIDQEGRKRPRTLVQERSKVPSVPALKSKDFSVEFVTRLGTGPEWDHRTGTNRYRTGTGRFDRVVDRYRDEPDRNYRDGGSVPSRPTIYRDRTGTDRNGPDRNGTG
ncbi:hypothetical protein MTR67_027505 [Solanum verrucosum]|uniref:Uncharacterized protein n=1 Tax=Solanum verrucosum TaxID=315347 RepID=A0AAF0TZL6_SOLVR|nr:hypothetical protein MTR67_027505 [Solanum verrucosum]